MKELRKCNLGNSLLKSHAYSTDSEKAMATHSSTLAWKIPRMEEPGRLQSMHGVAKSRTRLSDFTFTFHFHALEKEMATHFSVLACRIPGMGEPGGLLSMGHTESDTTEVISSSSIAQPWTSYKRLPKRLLQMSCLYFPLSTSLESK